jgi:hypothetical protein
MNETEIPPNCAGNHLVYATGRMIRMGRMDGHLMLYPKGALMASILQQCSIPAGKSLR